MKIELVITRKVLTEKYSSTEGAKEFFLSFIEGCEIKTSKEYPELYFYVKEDMILFHQQIKYKFFYVRYDIIWSVFKMKFGFSYAKTQILIKGLLKNSIKLNGYSPYSMGSIKNSKDWMILENEIKNDCMPVRGSFILAKEIIEFKSLGEYHPSSLNLATTSFKELSKKN